MNNKNYSFKIQQVRSCSCTYPFISLQNLKILDTNMKYTDWQVLAKGLSKVTKKTDFTNKRIENLSSNTSY